MDDQNKIFKHISILKINFYFSSKLIFNHDVILSLTVRITSTVSDNLQT